MPITCVPIGSMSCTGFAVTSLTHAEGIILRRAAAPYLDRYPHRRLFSAAPTTKPARCRWPASDAGRQPHLPPASSLRPRHPCPTAATPTPWKTRCSKGKGTLSRPGETGVLGAARAGRERATAAPPAAAPAGLCKAQRMLDLETASSHEGRGAWSAPSCRVPPPRSHPVPSRPAPSRRSREVAVFPHGSRRPRSQAGKGARLISLSSTSRRFTGMGFLVREKHTCE